MKRLYYHVMRSIFFTLMIIAMVAVLGSFLVGMYSMMKGGEFNEKYGNRLMRLRVLLQGVALAFFAAAILSGSND